jgi:hypothetical protein
LNTNQVHNSAVFGLSIVFDLLDNVKQENVADCFISSFLQSVRSCIDARSTTKDEERSDGADLSHALTSALIAFRGKDFVNKIYTKDVVTSLLHMVQWRYDPGTVHSSTEMPVWEASVANSLLLLLSLLWRPDETLVANRIDLHALASTMLMALNCAIEGNDASSALAGKRVL